ncbi:nicotinate phosphoribosyltransferase, (NAPRTase) family, partial [Teladorsagia circumcincta]
TITTWKREGEVAAFRNMLQQYPKGSISVVSDSYDVFHAVSTIWGEELREEVIERGKRGCLVIRPDSGDPVTVLLKVLRLLEEKFPVAANGKGYKVLPPYLRIIQGDGITYESIGAILQALMDGGWSADNVVFGAGGSLLQRLNRDTQKCAFKCSHVVVNGEQRDVYKNPVTDEGKRSKKGYLTLQRSPSGNLRTFQEGLGNPDEDILLTVFENGRLLVDWTLDEIRSKAEIDIVKESKKKEACMLKYISGWGPGGQKVNTAQNAVQLRHLPTGLVVKVHESRLLPKNIEIAFERMKYALDRHVNGDECYEEQFKRLQREKEAKANRKRELHRRKRKEAEDMSEGSSVE